MSLLRHFLCPLTLAVASSLVTTVHSAAAEPLNPTASPEPVALRVGSTTLSPNQYRDLAVALEETTGSISFAADENLLRQYAETDLLADSARRHNLDHDGVIAAKIRVAIDTVLAQAERDRLYKEATVTEEDVIKRFESQPNAYDEYSLSHILVGFNPGKETAKGATHRSEQAALARARQLKRRLDAGADFGTLARINSDDRSSAQEEGHLPGSLGMYLAPEFSSAIRRLRVGEVSEPVLGTEGYHLIRLDAHVGATLENRHKMIEAVLRDEAVTSATSALTRGVPVEFNRDSAE